MVEDPSMFAHSLVSTEVHERLLGSTIFLQKTDLQNEVPPRLIALATAMNTSAFDPDDNCASTSAYYAIRSKENVQYIDGPFDDTLSLILIRESEGRA